MTLSEVAQQIYKLHPKSRIRIINDRTNKKIHFITPIKDQKQQSLKGQSQHYKNNVTDDVYNRTTQNLNTILGNNGNRMLQNLIGT